MWPNSAHLAHEEEVEELEERRAQEVHRVGAKHLEEKEHGRKHGDERLAAQVRHDVRRHLRHLRTVRLQPPRWGSLDVRVRRVNEA